MKRNTPIAKALLSVSDKTGLVDFARGLAAHNIELLSTGGTAKHLKDAGLTVIDVSDYTGFPEMFDGRVKTLHHKIFGGLLQRRDCAEDQFNASSHFIHPIDLVVVNLYPFEQTVAKKDVAIEDAIENIDIGGPSLLRAAAKNHRWVTVVVDSDDYNLVLNDMRGTGNTALRTRKHLAQKVFDHTSKYDAHIAKYMLKQGFKLPAN